MSYNEKDLDLLFKEIDNSFSNDKENEIINNDKKKEENSNKITVKKNKKKRKNKIWIVFFALMDFIAFLGLFMMYGPISYFRNLWVTSAMSTMSHQYLAYTFFDRSEIEEIMNNNTVIESGENTNVEEVNTDKKEPEILSEFDKEILTKDPDNDLYKVIDVSGDGYVGHLLVLYDPSKIKLIRSKNYPKYGQFLQKMLSDNNAVAGINASGFTYSDYSGYHINGTLVMNGEILNYEEPTGWGGGIIGFTEDDVLVLYKGTTEEAMKKFKLRDAVSFGPFLIVNGVPSEFKGNGGYGLAPRTAIGQRKDGIVLMLVIDGRRPGHSIGVDMLELTNILLRYGAYNAVNLDGGGSSSMVVNNKLISVSGGYGYSGERYLAHAWAIIP